PELVSPPLPSMMPSVMSTAPSSVSTCATAHAGRIASRRRGLSRRLGMLGFLQVGALLSAPGVRRRQGDLYHTLIMHPRTRFGDPGEALRSDIHTPACRHAPTWMVRCFTKSLSTPSEPHRRAASSAPRRLAQPSLTPRL